MTQKAKPVIRLETETQLRIYMLPLRQRILRSMRIHGKSVTSKQIADELDISPSSARHHILRLREIGLVEHDRFELINGIRAEYLKAADVTVSIGTNTDDELTSQREAVAASMLSDVANRFKKTMKAQRERMKEDPSLFTGDLLCGIAHLSNEDAKECYRILREFLDAHMTPHAGTERPWEYALLFHEVPAP